MLSYVPENANSPTLGVTDGTLITPEQNILWMRFMNATNAAEALQFNEHVSAKRKMKKGDTIQWNIIGSTAGVNSVLLAAITTYYKQ